jgi:hypothetical protein
LGWLAAQVTVVLKHMFSPAELLEEPSLKEDLETDTLAECTKLGPVDKVRQSRAAPYACRQPGLFVRRAVLVCMPQTAIRAASTPCALHAA